MSILLGDPVTQLAFSIYENKGVFALLLGSGLSRAADIPTGWEITLDLIRRVALAQGVEEQPDWAAWHRERSGEEPNYSSLLEKLASSPEERRSILHSYIEPTAQDREEGRKVPTAAHKAIADMVRRGYVRVIITTNFDRLMENALRERGIEPTVVSSVDALSGAEPLTHSACYLVKLHGDYKDARILNTEAELSGYPAQYDTLLDRILDEHGLIICGWSGEWDHALRAALLRAPNRRYSTFWAARGQPGAGAADLIDHRRARHIPIADADSFFSSVVDRVVTLEQSHRQNPLSIDLLLNTTKRFLAKPEYRIQLDDLFTEETRRLMASLGGPEFGEPGKSDQDVFREQVLKHEAATEGLASMAGLLGRWGDDSELPLVLDAIRSLYSEAEKVRGGLASIQSLRSYPAVLVFTAYGVGLTRAERWGALHRLFVSVIHHEDREPVRAVEAVFLTEWSGSGDRMWKQLEGFERRKAPFGTHLFSVVGEWSKRVLGVTSAPEAILGQFEILGSLAYLERKDEGELQKTLSENPNHNWSYTPVGHTAMDRNITTILVGEMNSPPMKAAILEAGFANGHSDFLDMLFENHRRIAVYFQRR